MLKYICIQSYFFIYVINSITSYNNIIRNLNEEYTKSPNFAYFFPDFLLKKRKKAKNSVLYKYAEFEWHRVFFYNWHP